MSLNEPPVADRLVPADSVETASLPQRQVREFDPSPYLRQLRGRGGRTDYLDVRYRLLWLRTEHPDAQIVTELIRADDQCAVFKASVSIPGGGSATGHGSETVSDFNDFIEKAETKALGRALNALGFGSQFAEGETEETRPGYQQDNAGRPHSSRPGGSSMAAPGRQSGGVMPENELAEREDLHRFLSELGFESQEALEEAIGRTVKGLRRGEIRKLVKERTHAAGGEGSQAA